jgi:uncharacterized RDD family membrane protein YckC
MLVGLVLTGIWLLFPDFIVQVVDEDGATISLGKSILRSLAWFVPYFIGLGVLGGHSRLATLRHRGSACDFC